MPRRCFAELVAATSRIGTATADVENALYKPLIDVDIDFSSFWPPRKASLEGFWACVRRPVAGVAYRQPLCGPRPCSVYPGGRSRRVRPGRAMQMGGSKRCLRLMGHACDAKKVMLLPVLYTRV